MSKQRIPKKFAMLARSLCPSKEEMATTFSLPATKASKLLAGEKIEVTEEELQIIASVLSNQLRYAFPARVTALIEDAECRKNFLLWVHTAAEIISMFRRLKAIRNECKFVNGFDPFLAPMNSLSLAVDEVETFLNQLHEDLPSFDELFFSGTRFLDPNEMQNFAGKTIRVPSSVDVISLSPSDKKRYETIILNQKDSNGNHTENG